MNERFESLRALIETADRKEHECREYLKFVPALLFEETVIQYVHLATEYRGHPGDSDYIISGRIRDETGSESVKAYVWELKAPQCYVFEADNENRLKPSRDLMDAENKLLHFYDQLKGDDAARASFQVTHRDNVHLGGIIIGSRQTRVSGDYDHAKKEVLFETAKRIRTSYFYRPAGIRLLTWDRVLEQFGPRTSGQRETGDVGVLPVPPLPPRLDLAR